LKGKKALIEAALFASENPLSLHTLKKISGITSTRELKKILHEIKREFDVSTRGIELAITPEGYQFKVKDKFSEIVAPLTPHADLSDGMLRTLGLVAIRQPITQSEIVKIQGNKAYNYIKKIEKKGLITSEKAGRTRILRTTREFERYFGKSLKEIQETLRSVIEDETNKQFRTNVPDGETEEVRDQFQNSED